MRNPLRTLLLAAATGLSLLTGCSPGGTIDPAAVAAAAQLACGFLPLVSGVIAVLNANGTITSVEAAVKLICDAFKKTVVSGKLKAPAPGSQITIDVDVGNGKVVPVAGTVQ